MPTHNEIMHARFNAIIILNLNLTERVVLTDDNVVNKLSLNVTLLMAKYHIFSTSYAHATAS